MLLFERIDLSPIQSFINQWGPIKEIGWFSTANALLLFLPKYIIPYMLSSEVFSAPIELDGEYLSCSEISGAVYIVTTKAVFRLQSDPELGR